ncbi:hypothetical protein BSNK01_06670 [Bacillaceae bacterium]
MWWNWLHEHLGKVLGTSFGLMLGFVFLFFGFFKTLIFFALVLLGYYFGKKKDRKENLRDVLEKILPGKFFGH